MSIGEVSPPPPPCKQLLDFAAPQETADATYARDDSGSPAERRSLTAHHLAQQPNGVADSHTLCLSRLGRRAGVL